MLLIATHSGHISVTKKFRSWIIIIIITPWEFFASTFANSLSWSLSDSKSPQVSRILFSILADFNNALVWMVSTLPLISKSTSSLINPLDTLPWAPITIGLNVPFMFHIPLRVFHASVSWWVFTGVWVRASLNGIAWNRTVFAC